VEGHASKCEVGRGYYRVAAMQSRATGGSPVGAEFGGKAVRHTAEDRAHLTVGLRSLPKAPVAGIKPGPLTP